MKNRRKMQEAMERIVKLKGIIQEYDTKLKNAYFDYYLAAGFNSDQIKNLIK